MKAITLDLGWILETFSHTVKTDGFGNVSLYADINGSKWINLGLDKLAIDFDTNEIGSLEIEFKFKIEDIKSETNWLYTQWSEMNKQQTKYNKKYDKWQASLAAEKLVSS